MSRRRSTLRSNTGSVDASAAPRIAAEAGAIPSNHHAATAVSAAHTIVPGPSIRKARPALRLTSFVLSVTASVNRTRVKLSVAATRRIGDSSVMSKTPSPKGPSAAPINMKTATCGRPLLSTNPDRSADTMMTIPIKARPAINFSGSISGPILNVATKKHKKSLCLLWFLWLDKPRVTAFSNRQSKDANEPFNTGLDGNRRLFPFQSRYRALLRAPGDRKHQRVLPVGPQRAVVARRHLDGRDDLCG